MAFKGPDGCQFSSHLLEVGITLLPFHATSPIASGTPGSTPLALNYVSKIYSTVIIYGCHISTPHSTSEPHWWAIFSFLEFYRLFKNTCRYMPLGFIDDAKYGPVLYGLSPLIIKYRY